VITHRDFQQLRLRDFVPEVTALKNWQYMGRQWIGEAVGFSEWLRPQEDSRSLGSMASDFSDLPEDVAAAVLERVQLPLRPGMSLPEIVAVLGAPQVIHRFRLDRLDYDFEVRSRDIYSVSCTVHDHDGLIYLVVMPKEREYSA